MVDGHWILLGRSLQADSVSVGVFKTQRKGRSSIPLMTTYFDLEVKAGTMVGDSIAT